MKLLGALCMCVRLCATVAGVVEPTRLGGPNSGQAQFRGCRREAVSDQEGRRGGEPSKDVSSCRAVDRARIAGWVQPGRRSRMSAETGLPRNAEPVRTPPPAFVVRAGASQKRLVGTYGEDALSDDLGREVQLAWEHATSPPPPSPCSPKVHFHLYNWLDKPFFLLKNGLFRVQSCSKCD